MSHHTRLTTALVLFVTALLSWSLPTAEPDAVGLSPGKLDRLKPALQTLVDDGKIPGGIAMVARRARLRMLPRSAAGTWKARSRSPWTRSSRSPR